MADPVKPTAPAAPEQPAAIKLSAAHAWFTKAGAFVEAKAGEVIYEAEHIAQLIAHGAKFTAV